MRSLLLVLCAVMDAVNTYNAFLVTMQCLRTNAPGATCSSGNHGFVC